MKLRTVGLLAAVIGVGSLSASANAAAVLRLFAQEAGVDGGAGVGNVAQVGVDGTFGASGTFFSGTYGDFTISIFSSTSKNATPLSNLLSSTTSVTNNASTAKTLQLWVSETDYSLPTGGPLQVESGLAGSVAGGTVSPTGIFQAWFDAGNNLRGTGGGTNGLQNAVPTGTTFDTGSAIGGFAHTGNNLYSLTSEAILNISGGGVVNYADHVNVAVPVPAAAWMGLSTLAGLAGLGAVRRRRQA